jgi:hypothetical protein
MDELAEPNPASAARWQEFEAWLPRQWPQLAPLFAALHMEPVVRRWCPHVSMGLLRFTRYGRNDAFSGNDPQAVHVLEVGVLPTLRNYINLAEMLRGQGITKADLLERIQATMQERYNSVLEPYGLTVRPGATGYEVWDTAAQVVLGGGDGTAVIELLMQRLAVYRVRVQGQEMGVGNVPTAVGWLVQAMRP